MAWFKEKKRPEEEKKKLASPHNTQAENDLLNTIDTAQQYAEGGKRAEIETDWDDEYKIYIGKQWDTSKGSRTAKGKKRNFNSQDNYVFSTMQNMRSSFSETPVIQIGGEEESDDEAGEVLTDLTANIFKRNLFPEQYDKLVLQMIQYGPVIGYVPWDQHWIGGSGPNRWVGEVRTLFQKKSEFYPDPAILDLEERLQECSYINLKQRKKIDWFKDTWPKKGVHVLEDAIDIAEGQEDEGQDPQQATLITHFHKGTPKFVSAEWKQIFLDKAKQAEESNLPFLAKDLRSMAAGELKGVHCAYKAGTILLDYVPYIYDDGLYPFVYKVLYADEEQPWGMGEERNIVIPQILHNKADEIELGAMLGQGLGGGFYDKGSISLTQKEELLDNIAKPNSWIEVNNKNGIQEKRAVQVPSTITQYKDSKKNVIDTISRNTSILQGEAPGNMPLGVVRELGSRADGGTFYKAKVLERFMLPFVQLIINRITQFYTEERKYRVLGDKSGNTEKAIADAVKQIANMPQGTPPEIQLQAIIDLLKFAKEQDTPRPRTAKFNRTMLVRTWDRDKYEDGTPMKEEFIPEFDINIKIIKEVPTDRNYYINLSMQLLGKVMGPKAFWSVMESGKFPPAKDIIAELEQTQQAQMQAQMSAVQAQILAEQQENEKDRRAKLLAQDATNESQVEMTAISAAAKAGGNRNEGNR
jgi:hypothetical protein